MRLGACVALVLASALPAQVSAQTTHSELRRQVTDGIMTEPVTPITAGRLQMVLLLMVDAIPELPGTCTTGQVLRWGTGAAWVCMDLPAGAADWARASGPTGFVPLDRLASGGSDGDLFERTATGTRWVSPPAIPGNSDIDARIAAPARDGSTDRWGLSKLPAQFSRLPTSACSTGQVWKAVASGSMTCQPDAVGAGGGIDASAATLLIAGFARATQPAGAAGLMPGNRIASGGTEGQVVQLGANGVLQYASIAPRTPEYILRQVATWAARTGPTGRIAANLMGATPANGRFLVATSATAASFRALLAADVPNLDAAKINSGTFGAGRLGGSPAANRFLAATSATAAAYRAIAASDVPDLNASKVTAGEFDEARIPDLPGSKIASGVVNAQRIDNAIARDAELPDALFAAGTRGFGSATTGHVLTITGTSDPITRTGMEWRAPASGGGGTPSLVTDWSSLSYSMTRANVATAARQVTIAAAAIDAQHDISIASGCIVIGTNGGGPYYYSASAEVTPNRSDDTDPTDEGGPHRNFAIWEIRRTRGSVTQTVFRTSPYVRGFQTNSSPASQWVSFDGRIPTAAGDTYCIYVDATRASAHQADYLTISDGEIALSSDRIVVTQ